MIGREPWFSGYGRSWVQIPAPDTQWSFFTLIWFKNCIGFSKDRNKMEKRPRKTLSIPNIGCWFPLIRTTSSLNIPLWHKPTLSLTHFLSHVHTTIKDTFNGFQNRRPIEKAKWKMFWWVRNIPSNDGVGVGDGGYEVWPYLAKFRHFGEILKVLTISLWVNLAVGAFYPTLAKYYDIG